MVGNLADATLALATNRYEGTLRSLYLFSVEGTTRTVYLINGVIYKVAEGEENVWEYDNMTTGRGSLPEGVFFPNVSLYEVEDESIIAMDYIEGQVMAECYCWGDETHLDSCMPLDILYKVQPVMGDTGGANVILKPNGDIYIIDAA